MNRKEISRIVLGAFLITTGISHLTIARKAFKAQVPESIPLKKDDTVVYSGIAEIVLGAATIIAPKKYGSIMGKTVAAFFVAVLPGNISQYKHRKDSFGLDTDQRRFARLFMQIPLVIWAVCSGEKSGKRH